MARDVLKPTLDRTRDAAPAEDLRALDLVEAATLLALHRSTYERVPTCPCLALTLELAFLLEKRGVIDLCEDAANLGGELPARAIYDPLAWRYRWPSATAPDFAERIRARVNELANDSAGVPAKHALWQILANAELEGYLGYLLRKHGFDPHWAIDARDEGQRWARGLSLAQMRYVAWASVREGAAAFLRSAGDIELARDAIATEIRRRTRWIEMRPSVGAEFVPAPNTRQSTLLTIFLEEIAPVGRRYWLASPSESLLRECMGLRDRNS